MKTPKDFTVFSIGSVLQKCEAEDVAQNIMKILARTGNKFRKLSFYEYEKERKKDGDFNDMEIIYFKRVISYCKNADTAKLFSKSWNK